MRPSDVFILSRTLFLKKRLKIVSLKMNENHMIYCPFSRSNKYNIILIYNSQIIRFVVDQLIGSTFYAEQR